VRTIIHCCTTIGGDGFGYLQVEGRNVKIPQVGTVEIGDDVEIGCNCTIDRATMDKTVIGNGVKMDNHSHIAHNCQIGDHAVLIAYARMGGSTTLGKNVVLCEDVGLTNGISLGDRCIVGAGSKVTHSWPADSVILGAPAQRGEDEKRQIVLIKKLPRLYETVRELKRRVEGDAAPARED
jgi:UDP-3-O-[3-hydroxymyristoyl] glucosamine N-acyltransferase